MTIDLTDLGGGPGKSDSKAAAADGPKTQTPQGPKSYNVAVIQFWDRYICRCGAEHEGPRAGYHPAYFKRWNGSRNAYEFNPIGQSERVPLELPRYISLAEISIPCCPWCHPVFDGYPDTDPEYGARDASSEQELSAALEPQSESPEPEAPELPPAEDDDQVLQSEDLEPDTPSLDDLNSEPRSPGYPNPDYRNY